MFLKNKEIHKACDVNRAHALLMTVFQQCINNKNAQYQIDAGSTGKVTNILLLCNYSSTLDKPFGADEGFVLSAKLSKTVSQSVTS